MLSASMIGERRSAQHGGQTNKAASLVGQSEESRVGRGAGARSQGGSGS